jgi:phthiodiolone/phenolphthiodiolone dimycocerosates ketoreductase
MTRLSFGYVNRAIDPMKAVQSGVLAEKNEFDTFWVADHFVDVWPDGDRLEPWGVLSALAVKTKKIRLGSGVTDALRSHPARIAQTVACLDMLSRGRAILGIGAGEAMNLVPYGLSWERPFERISRLSEAIQIIRLLWISRREKRVNFDGQFYQLHQAFLMQSPEQKPCPQIYVGAFGSKRALELVGRYGDGWYSWLNTPDTFRTRWSVVKQAAESADRSAARINPVAYIAVAFPEGARQEKVAVARGKATLLVEKTVLESVGQTPQTDQFQNLVHLPKAYVSKILDAVDQVPDEIVYKTMAIGGIEEVKTKINEFEHAGARTFAVFDLLGGRNPCRTMRTLGKIVRYYR